MREEGEEGEEEGEEGDVEAAEAVASPVAVPHRAGDFPAAAGNAVARLRRRAAASVVADSSRRQRAGGKVKPALRGLLLSRVGKSLRASARKR